METYVEKELLPLGFDLFKKVRLPESSGPVVSVMLRSGRLKLQFDCICPQPPGVIAVGCPIHHKKGMRGKPKPVEQAKRIPQSSGVSQKTRS